ncbi:hypothetical protein ACH4PU_30780 [Streptomyces sp. NPDC021100]|uniref:hypothetical protein n=1 Tax=Streptomyces sp. NPDC021100 TaxID=3365114 RepID=UPI003798E3B8
MKHQMTDAVPPRVRCTGETRQQILATALPSSATCCGIPAARHRGQAELESAVALAAAGLGGLSRHPIGIKRVHPEPDRLTLFLLDEPYVIHSWAERLLPTADPTAGELRDHARGVFGLRFRTTATDVRLYRPGKTGEVRLRGFNPRWWHRIAHGLAGYYGADAVFTHSDTWSRAEHAADAAHNAMNWNPFFGSALLRRILATTGPGSLNGTDLWQTTLGGRQWTVETTDGPSCSELLPLFTQPPTGLGWTVTKHWCRCGEGDDGCHIYFRTTDPSQGVYFANRRWGRLELDDRTRAHIAALNRSAFSF